MARPQTELNLKSSFARGSFAIDTTEGTAAAQQAGPSAHHSFQDVEPENRKSQQTFFGEEQESGSGGGYE